MGMNRRELLVGATVALGTAEAAAATKETLRFDADAVEAKLKMIDRRMGFFRTMDLSPRPAENDEEATLFASRNEVARASFRSIYFMGAFMELPEHERAHPGVQARMARLQPEMDTAVDGMATYLEGLTPEDLRGIQDEFKKDPALGMRIGERLHDVAAEDGLGFNRRNDIRMAIDDLSRRMRTQNPALVIEPYIQKTRKIQANPGTDLERERAFAVRAGEKAFWEFQERSKQYVAAWDTTYAARPRIDLVAMEENYPEIDTGHPPDPTSGAKKVLTVGGYLMGAGLASFAGAGIFYLISTLSGSLTGFVAGAIVLGTTIGPLLVLGGIVVLIVGGIMYASKKP